jgi:hypothetical protein
MARSCGVKCKETGEPVAFEELDPFTFGKVSFHVLPFDPFRCPACGEEHQYQSKEGFEFEADSLAVRKIPR